MNPSLVAPASNSEFDVRVRQAIRSARNSLPQLAVLVFSLDRCTATTKCNEKDLARFQNAVLMRLRGGLRETDSVALLSNGHFGVLLQSVQGAQDLDLIINRLLGRLDEDQQDTLINMDAPRHTRVRRILAGPFAARSSRTVESSARTPSPVPAAAMTASNSERAATGRRRAMFDYGHERVLRKPLPSFHPGERIAAWKL